MADEDKVVQDIELQGGQEVEDQLNRIGDAGERAFARLGDAADKGAKQTEGVGDAVAGVARQAPGLARIEQAAGRVGESLRSVGQNAIAVGREFPRMAGAASAALGVLTGAMFALSKAASDTLSKVKEASIAAGVSAQEFTRMGFAANQSGANISKLERAFAVINTGGADLSDTLRQQREQLADARAAAGDAVAGYSRLGRQQDDLGLSFARGTIQLGQYLSQQASLRQQYGQVTSQADAAENAVRRLETGFARTNNQTVTGTAVFQRYGIAVKNADGTARDASEVFKDFADVIKQIPDPAQRAAVAAQAFGRRVGPGLVELLSEGRAGIEALGKEAERLGHKFETAEIELGDKFGDTLSSLTDTVKAVAVRIGLAFGPSFISLMQAVQESIVVLTPVILSVANAVNSVFGPSVQFITNLLGPLGVGVGSVAAAVAILVAGFRVLMTVLAPFAGIIKGAFAPFIALGTGALAIGRLLASMFMSVVNVLRLVGVVAAVSMGGILGPLSLIAAAVGVLIVAFGSAETSTKSWGDAARDTFKSIMGYIQPIIDAVGGMLTDAFRGLSALVTSVLIPAFQGVKKAADELAVWLNSTFGTNVNSVQLLGAAVVALAIAFGGLPAALTAVVVAVGYLIQKFDENRGMMIALGIVVAGLILAFGSIPIIIAAVIVAVGFVIAKWNELSAVGGAVTGFIKQKFEDLGNWFAGTWVGKLVGVIGTAIKAFNDLFNAAGRARGAAEQAAASSGGAEGFRTGGEVHGPGTSTSDSILARLSRGEFVIRADAVRKYGTSFLHAINQMRAPLKGLRGFRLGGLVDAINGSVPIPRFAGGGVVESQGSMGRAIVLNIGGETFNLVARETDTANRLGRYATKRRIGSTGRKPSYYGAGR